MSPTYLNKNIRCPVGGKATMREQKHLEPSSSALVNTLRHPLAQVFQTWAKKSFITTYNNFYIFEEAQVFRLAPVKVFHYRTTLNFLSSEALQGAKED
jgi:hypothetical protein